MNCGNSCWGGKQPIVSVEHYTEVPCCLKPDMKMHILLTVLHKFLMERKEGDLSKYGDISSMVITFLILITWTLNK